MNDDNFQIVKRNRYLLISIIAIAFVLLTGCMEEEGTIEDDGQTKLRDGTVTITFIVTDGDTNEPVDGVQLQNRYGDYYSGRSGLVSYTQEVGNTVTNELSKDGYKNSYFEVFANSLPLIQSQGNEYIYPIIDNSPPIADAGKDIITTPYDYEEIDASDSSDPDGSIILYEWDFDSNGDIDLYSTDPFVSHTFPEGKHNVTLKVTDDYGDADVDYVIVTSVKEKSQVKETPGFEGLIIALLIVGVIMRRYKK